MKDARKLFSWLLLLIVLAAGAYFKLADPVPEPGATKEASSTAKTEAAFPKVTAASAVPWHEKKKPAATGKGPVHSVVRGSAYDDRDSVAEYIYLYRELPPNYITKSQAKKLGWPGGDLRPYAPDKCIGGDRFGNFEGQLPGVREREYRECDIDTLGKASRGAKRLVYSDDGWIYYTADHYKTFETLYQGK